MTTSTTHAAQAISAPIRFYRRVREGLPLEYRVEACHSIHSRYAVCEACVLACPVNALALTEEGVALDASCSGCGRCAAACPSAALGIPGFAIGGVDAAATAPLHVECWKVSPFDSSRGALRVPCLGGIPMSRLVELRVAAGVRPILLLDRGWCESCASGGKHGHPVAARLAEAVQLLQGVGVPKEQWPQLVVHALPPERRSSAKADRASEQALSRRGFFSELAARATHTVGEINPWTSGRQAPVAPGHARVPEPSLERHRLLTQLRILAQRNGSPLPASLFPALQLDAGRCSHHQLCASTCPTGALRTAAASGLHGLVFDASACIACNQCVRICPEQALHLHAPGDGAAPSGLQLLNRVRRQSCSDCGRDFEPTASESACPACSKRAQLAQSAFHTLFGRMN